jgi:hypothetical protein
MGWAPSLSAVRAQSIAVLPPTNDEHSLPNVDSLPSVDGLEKLQSRQGKLFPRDVQRSAAVRSRSDKERVVLLPELFDIYILSDLGVGAEFHAPASDQLDLAV